MKSFSKFITESTFSFPAVSKETRAKVEASFGKPVKTDAEVGYKIFSRLRSANISGVELKLAPNRENQYRSGFWFRSLKPDGANVSPQIVQKGKYLSVVIDLIGVEASNSLYTSYGMSDASKEKFYNDYVKRAKEIKRSLQSAGFTQVWAIGSYIIVRFAAADFGIVKGKPNTAEVKEFIESELLKLDRKADIHQDGPDIVTSRYWGAWYGDDGSGDYDYQELDPSWFAKAQVIAKAAEKKFKGLKVSPHTGEKNYLYFNLSFA